MIIILITLICIAYPIYKSFYEYFVVYLDPGTPLDEDVVKEQVIGGTAIGISVALSVVIVSSLSYKFWD